MLAGLFNCMFATLTNKRPLTIMKYCCDFCKYGQVLLIFIISSCSQDNQVSESDLKGKWILKKQTTYMNGKDNVFIVKNAVPGGPEYMWGSIEDPLIVEFTKHREVIMGKVSLIAKDPTTSVHQYTVEGDTIKFSGLALRLSKASKDTLVMTSEVKLNYYDKSVPHGRQIMTFYYTR